MKLPKFNQKGFGLHALLPVLVIGIVSVIGVRLLTASKAAEVTGGGGGGYTNGKIFFGVGTINGDGTGVSSLYGIPDEYNSNISFDGNKVAYDNFTVKNGVGSNYSLHVATISGQFITNKIALSQYPSGYYVEDPPKWSPDGTKVAVMTPSKPNTVAGGTRIWVGQTDGSAGHFVQNLPNSIDGFGWLPGSQNLVYTQHTSSGNAFCTISTGGVSYGCHTVALGTGVYLGMDLAVSPVNGKVALLAGHNSPSYLGFSQYIYTVKPDGSGLTRILALGNTKDITAVAYSPDETKLVFYQEDVSTNNFNQQITTVNTDGSGLNVISSRGAPNSLSWAHK